MPTTFDEECRKGAIRRDFSAQHCAKLDEMRHLFGYVFTKGEPTIMPIENEIDHHLNDMENHTLNLLGSLLQFLI